VAEVAVGPREVAAVTKVQAKRNILSNILNLQCDIAQNKAGKKQLFDEFNLKSTISL
jgi:hypothetical protein